MASPGRDLASGSGSGSHDDEDQTPAVPGSWYHELDPEGADVDDDDEDDADYQDEAEEEGDGYNDYDNGDDDFYDAPDSDNDGEEGTNSIRFGDLEFQVLINPDDGDEDNGPGSVSAQFARGAIPIMRLLRAARVGEWSGSDILEFLQQPDANEMLERLREEGGQEVVVWEFNRRLRRQPKDPNRFPKVPSEAGTRLMYSGSFGSYDHDRFPNKHINRRLLERELGLGTYYERKLNKDLITQSLVPATPADHIIHYEEPVYSGQFSDDGNFFYSCSQDFKVRLYDTSNPYEWKHYKTASYPWGQWTLTDASLSPDNRWLAYTSHSSLVSIAPTDPLDEGDPYSLDLSDAPGMRPGTWVRSRGFSGIFSIRFSGNGRELVAGTNRNSVVVYDIESRTVLHNIMAHENDVNAVCFADKYSPHIIYSGSDDATIKVWDRRSMGDRREVGAFVGHVEGLTYIDSKGDGRYILSNGKDQSMKLWDLRMVMSRADFKRENPTKHTRHSDFDYRTSRYDENLWDVHPNDNSVVTFRGHKVLHTLIRCHFSPPGSTNSRYVYSGSRDGKVHIWNMDATKAGEIDVREATRGSRPRDPRLEFYFTDEGGSWATCVRDASWHPNAPFLVASALNGYSMSNGTCSLHSYGETDDDDGMDAMPRNMNESLKPTRWQEAATADQMQSDSDESE